MWKGITWKVGSGSLSADDLARVGADPAMQRRWVETWQAAAPLLADVERILLTKSHLRESVPLTEAVGHLPYDPTFSWDGVFLGSVGTLSARIPPWVRAWSAVRRRWEEDRFEMLQPRYPALWQPFIMVAQTMQGQCGKKELELQGATSVAARGGTTFFAAQGAAGDEADT
jgi:hypothetical protein